MKTTSIDNPKFNPVGRFAVKASGYGIDENDIISAIKRAYPNDETFNFVDQLEIRAAMGENAFSHGITGRAVENRGSIKRTDDCGCFISIM